MWWVSRRGEAASTAAGAAVTLLAPVTALAITGIGILFAIKTHKKNKNLLERSTPTKAYLNSVTDQNLDQYIKFSTAKIEQREAFYKEFERYNKLFIAASVLYSGSAIGKALIIGAALAGVGLLSNPVTIGGTAAVGIVAGLGMALTSHHFITGHNKQHRYEKYTSQDSKLLNRDFLVSADLLTSRENGLELRAGLYQLIKEQDHLRQNFLLEIAEKQNRIFKKKLHSTDEGFQPKKTFTSAIHSGFKRLRNISSSPQRTEDPQRAAGRVSSFRKRFHASCLAMKDSFQALFHQNIKAALKNAKEAREHLINRLNTYAVQNELLSSDNEKQSRQVEFIHNNLTQMEQYLKQKISSHKEIIKNIITNIPDKQSESTSAGRTGERVTLKDLFNQDYEWRDSTPSENDHSAAPHNAPNKLKDQWLKLDTLTQINGALQKLLLQYNKDLATDTSFLKDVKQSIANAKNLLEKINTNTQDDIKKEIKNLRGHFLILQEGKHFLPEDEKRLEAETSEQNARRFAKYLLHDAPSEYKHQRGILVEVEMQTTQARQLHEKFDTGTSTHVKSVPPSPESSKKHDAKKQK